MEIKATITGIEYQAKLHTELKEVSMEDFDINITPSNFLLKFDKNKLAVSKWVSPKRTRSYPYERVYNTLSSTKKITIIPLVKDEGKTGDRDFIQWDTIALMSLLDVYVIPAYYNDADKRITSKGKAKITNQKFDNQYIIQTIKAIPNYHSSALHWNLKQVKNLEKIVEKVKVSYAKIAAKTGVELKSEKGIDNFLSRLQEGMGEFMKFSRTKAQGAQNREFVTIQPKEALSTSSKAKITIKNYLGGLYYFTVDEIEKSKNTLQLIEAKHSISTVLPSRGDIKDGLIKMILYTNLEDVHVDGKAMIVQPVLKLTSTKIKNTFDSRKNKLKLVSWCEAHDLKTSQVTFLNQLVDEARENGFSVIIEQA